MGFQDQKTLQSELIAKRWTSDNQTFRSPSCDSVLWQLPSKQRTIFVATIEASKNDISLARIQVASIKFGQVDYAPVASKAVLVKVPWTYQTTLWYCCGSWPQLWLQIALRFQCVQCCGHGRWPRWCFGESHCSKAPEGRRHGGGGNDEGSAFYFRPDDLLKLGNFGPLAICFVSEGNSQNDGPEEKVT